MQGITDEYNDVKLFRVPRPNVYARCNSVYHAQHLLRRTVAQGIQREGRWTKFRHDHSGVGLLLPLLQEVRAHQEKLPQTPEQEEGEASRSREVVLQAQLHDPLRRGMLPAAF